MGHTRRRPITGRTADGVGITYIVVEMAADDTNVQVVANGTVTFTVDSTLENILYDTATQAAINLSSPGDPDRYIDPTDAVWENQLASGSISANFQMVSEPVFALRVNVTAGTGSVTYTVLQA